MGLRWVLGVDDFALRKGHAYGTVLVNIETRRPIDILPERSAEFFRAWLDAHRALRPSAATAVAGYAAGAAEGAPLAIQVADRWHLWQMRREALIDRVEVRGLRHCLVAVGR